MAAERLTTEGLPALFHSADESARGAQSAYRRATAAVLLFLIVAAAGGLITADAVPGRVHWGGVVSALGFLGSLAVQIYLASTRPERAWYEGRALSESAKSLAWQYAAGAGSFARSSGNDSDGALLDSLDCLRADFSAAQPFEAPPGREQITQAMRDVRAAPLEARRDAYLRDRIHDQRTWYSQKAQSNRRWARFWSGATIVLQLAAGAAAVLKATGIVELDLFGVASALIASIVAWVQLQDHTRLAEAYALASHDLSFAEPRIVRPANEAEWSAYVLSVEQAISREHRMWRAARSGGV